MEYASLIVFGLIFGSFLNVCIYRIPRNESLAFPRSHCPNCGHPLPWYENIPILSYVFLMGKCSKCHKKISIIYPIVEMLTAVLAVTLYQFYDLTLNSAIYFILFSSLIVASFVDFERQEIPDVITLPGIAIGLLISILYPALLSKTRMWAFLDSVIGILVGGGMLYLIGFIGEFIFKKEAMGGGDIKLLAMVGAFLGWKIALLTFMIAPFFGSVVGIILKIKEGREIIPYGPYLSLAAFIALLWGDKILQVLFLI